MNEAVWLTPGVNALLLEWKKARERHGQKEPGEEARTL
jgi:hypothetical protein